MLINLGHGVSYNKKNLSINFYLKIKQKYKCTAKSISYGSSGLPKVFYFTNLNIQVNNWNIRISNLNVQVTNLKIPVT